MPTYFSPCKINLFLRVLGRRGDGFHELATAIQALSLGDLLAIEQDEEENFSCTIPELPMDERNLVVRALRLFQERTGWKQTVTIHLEKRTPHEAGLGGGSSNAATTLWALNELSGLQIATETLSDWGAELGSDVPFFFSHGTALCEGRGEKVEDLPALQLPSLTLVKPGFGLSTPAVFRDLNLSECSPLSCQELVSCLGSPAGWVNDLIPPAYRLAPGLLKLEDKLMDAGYEQVMMSGSGTTLVCCGEGKSWDDPNLGFYLVKAVNRKSGRWYEL